MSTFGGFFPGTYLGKIFPGVYTPIPGGIHLRGTSSPGRNHTLGCDRISMRTRSLGIHQPYGSTNIGGPQGSTRTIENSPPS
jgi:hypothetical protein